MCSLKERINGGLIGKNKGGKEWKSLRERIRKDFFYSHKIYNNEQLQYKSKGSMEIHNNP